MELVGESIWEYVPFNFLHNCISYHYDLLHYLNTIGDSSS
jgi:hypothetical protein